MNARNFVPVNITVFLLWLKKVIEYAVSNAERWGVAKPDDDLVAKATELDKLATKCDSPTCSLVDIRERNNLRKIVEKDIRNYLRGMITYNTKVTDRDRDMMGLPIRDTKPSPIGEPVGLVTAMIQFLNEGALELHIVHVDGTPYDKRANYGVKIVYGVFPVGAPKPESVNALMRSIFTRRKKEVITFADGESHMVVWFRLRYENSKGKIGQWGPMISAIIP